MSITWDPAFAIGVAEIDAQHQELFARLDAFLVAAQQEHAREELGRLLRFLQSYVREHFSAEERLMGARGYPELPAHHAEHERFAAELAELVRAYEGGGGTLLLSVKANSRVTAWLRDHIMRRDRAFAAFLTGERPRPA